MHIFFKLPRPVYRPLESPFPFLPPLYVSTSKFWFLFSSLVLDIKLQRVLHQMLRNLMIQEVVAIDFHFAKRKNLTPFFFVAYLGSLVNSSAICDRCMTSIEGEWFRCAYCACDLCDACEEMDTHDDTHVFMVFKSLVSY